MPLSVLRTEINRKKSPKHGDGNLYLKLRTEKFRNGQLQHNRNLRRTPGFPRQRWRSATNFWRWRRRRPQPWFARLPDAIAPRASRVARCSDTGADALRFVHQRVRRAPRPAHAGSANESARARLDSGEAARTAHRQYSDFAAEQRRHGVGAAANETRGRCGHYKIGEGGRRQRGREDAVVGNDDCARTFVFARAVDGLETARRQRILRRDDAKQFLSVFADGSP